MKYCQKCKAMLTDETEVCPSCGTHQLPTLEYEVKEKKKKTFGKVLLRVLGILAAAVAAGVIIVLIAGKEPAVTAVDEEYTAEVTDEEVLEMFTTYVEAAVPEIWDGSDENVDYAIEYYNENGFPDVAKGFEQIKELRPAAGSSRKVKLKSAAVSEMGDYKLVGELVCDSQKINFTIVLGASGYVDSVSFEKKEENFPQKARYFLQEELPEITKDW